MAQKSPYEYRVTVPDVITLSGAAVSWWGAKRINTWRGIAAYAAGRVVGDLLDGYTARRLGQVTQHGKFLDSFADKVINAKVLREADRHGILPPVTSRYIKAHNATKFILTGAAVAAGVPQEELETSPDGKIGMALDVGSVFSHAAGERLEEQGETGYADLTRNIGRVATALSAAVYGPRTILDYARRIRREHPDVNLHLPDRVETILEA